MGACTSKPSNLLSQNPSLPEPDVQNPNLTPRNGEGKDSRDGKEDVRIQNGKKSPFFALYTPSPANYPFSKKSPANSVTPKRFFRPPPSPAKHIRAALARRRGRIGGSAVSGEGGGEEGGAGLDKSFGFSKNFAGKYEIGEEVGRGHFGYTCCAVSKKGEMKGLQVAVKVIPKAKVCFLF
ncbi:hypothetical protein MLD38_004606 [Melastoma candidum]|uniref:Uncharacterized protein n=1 Tax=Melastoma candidum TaxID=119954 RepID=A0ACB9S852_9MYRT|nr:hypothetical protein MLD38_004606 [Melastoma candidum]